MQRREGSRLGRASCSESIYSPCVISLLRSLLHPLSTSRGTISSPALPTRCWPRTKWGGFRQCPVEIWLKSTFNTEPGRSGGLGWPWCTECRLQMLTHSREDSSSCRWSEYRKQGQDFSFLGGFFGNAPPPWGWWEEESALFAPRTVVGRPYGPRQ